MKRAFIVTVLFFAASLRADTSFDTMLDAAKKGDDMARVVVAYSYYFGEYRDGTKVEKNINKAFAWACLAGFQGNKAGKKFSDGIGPKLTNRKEAEQLAGEYFKLYGARPGTSKNQ
jgi:hypothetical protein